MRDSINKSMSDASLRRHRMKLVSRGISWAAFFAWLVLMLTVIVDHGGALQIIMVTSIPFAAHVVSVLLAANADAAISSAPSKPQGESL